MDASLVDTAIISRKHKRDEKEEFKKKIIVIAAAIVIMFVGVVAWYHNEYLVKESAHNWELNLEDASDTVDLEEPSSGTKRKGQSSTSTGTKSQKRKIGEKDGIIALMKKVAESLKQFLQGANKKLDEKDIQEVLHEVDLIPNLDEQQWAKAVKWLTENLYQLVVVRALPIQEKEAYILAFIS